MNKLTSEIIAYIEKKSFPEENRLLQTIPGVSETCAATILAKIGPTVTAFPSDESAGIKKILTHHARKSLYQTGFDYVGIDCSTF
ncbi:transposase [Streptococcus sp. HF-1907]|uniref:transposase n=1 Tax=Streptococcus sp. HF-1907 TaxID=2785793 RepID=UPI00189C70D2|nr:transposase [Streptococcus sp. HF-1907]